MNNKYIKTYAIVSSTEKTHSTLLGTFLQNTENVNKQIKKCN